MVPNKTRENKSATRTVAGCMTGTSMDGLDIAIAVIMGSGIDMDVRLEYTRSFAFTPELHTAAAAISSGELCTAQMYTSFAHSLGLFHARCLATCVDDYGPIDYISVHGQTVFHEPPLSHQIINVHPIAEALNSPVVFDLRGADLAAGGEGAPISPLADYILLRHPNKSRLILNLGGFVNYTWLPSSSDVDDVQGGDVCACNHLLNAVAVELLHRPFDEGGEAACRGDRVEHIVDNFCEVLMQQWEANRSLGSAKDLGFSRLVTEMGRDYDADSIARSATVAIARVLSECLQGMRPSGVLVAGGSVRNRTLLHEMQTAFAPIPVESLATVGYDPQYREALIMVVLGTLAQDRNPITLAQVTHAVVNGDRPLAPCAGCWVYPPYPDRHIPHDD